MVNDLVVQTAGGASRGDRRKFKFLFSSTWTWTSRCSSWFQKRQRNQRSNCQHLLDHGKSKRVPDLSGSVVKNLPTSSRHRRWGFDPWIGKIPWSRKWQLTPVFLSGTSHGQRSLAGYSPQGHKESDTTEWLSKYTCNSNKAFLTWH